MEDTATALYNRATNTITDVRVVHVRYQGESRDIPWSQLSLSENFSDDDVKWAIAEHLDISIDLLKNTVVERHENQNLTVRPEAVFG